MPRWGDSNATTCFDYALYWFKVIGLYLLLCWVVSRCIQLPASSEDENPKSHWDWLDHGGDEDSDWEDQQAALESIVWTGRCTPSRSGLVARGG